MSISEQLRTALEKLESQGETRYRIAQEARINQTILAYFMDGERTLKLEPTVDRLCEYVGLELKPKAAARK